MFDVQVRNLLHLRPLASAITDGRLADGSRAPEWHVDWPPFEVTGWRWGSADGAGDPLELLAMLADVSIRVTDGGVYVDLGSDGPDQTFDLWDCFEQHGLPEGEADAAESE